MILREKRYDWTALDITYLTKCNCKAFLLVFLRRLGGIQEDIYYYGAVGDRETDVLDKTGWREDRLQLSLTREVEGREKKKDSQLGGTATSPVYWFLIPPPPTAINV